MSDTHDYARLFENAPVGILRSTEGGRILTANPALVEILGYGSREEVLQLDLGRDVYVRASDREALVERTRSGAYENVVARWRRADGSEITVRISGRPLEDGDGIVVYESFVEDVTEESETRQGLERVLASSGAILFRLSVKGDGPPRARWVSPSVQSILGYMAEEALQPAWWPSRIHPDDRTATIETLSGVFEDGRAVQEYRFRRKDGSYAWLRDESHLLLDEEGDPYEIVGVWTDITERRRAEQALNRVLSSSGAILMRLAVGEEGPAGVWISRSVEEVLGYTQEEALRPGWWPSGLHPDDRQGALEAAQSVLTDDDIVHEYRFCARDGEFRWIREELHLVRDEDGRPFEIVGVGTNVTELKEREAELRRSEERFRRLTEAAPDAVVAADAEGVVVVVNPAAERMFGYEAAELLGRHFTLLFPERFREANGRALQRMLEARAPETLPPRGLLGRRKDGSEFPAEVAVATEPDGGQFAVTAIIRDLTQRLELEAERDLLRRGLVGDGAAGRTLVSICSSCKNIRDDDGGWHPVEIYVRDRAPIEFSHGMCPTCLERLYGHLP